MTISFRGEDKTRASLRIYSDIYQLPTNKRMDGDNQIELYKQNDSTFSGYLTSF